MLTKATSFSEQGRAGEAVALQCQVHSLMNLFGLLFFFVEICDSSVLVFIAGGKKTQVNDVVVILGILIVRFEIG